LSIRAPLAPLRLEPALLDLFAQSHAHLVVFFEQLQAFANHFARVVALEGLPATRFDCRRRWDALSWWAVPDQHIRTQVSSVGPHHSTVLNARRPEDSEIVTNPIEDGTDEQRLDVPFDDRSIG
jgi:hypothetical protein